MDNPFSLWGEDSIELYWKQTCNMYKLTLLHITEIFLYIRIQSPLVLLLDHKSKERFKQSNKSFQQQNERGYWHSLDKVPCASRKVRIALGDSRKWACLLPDMVGVTQATTCSTSKQAKVEDAQTLVRISIFRDHFLICWTSVV